MGKYIPKYLFAVSLTGSLKAACRRLMSFAPLLQGMLPHAMIMRSAWGYLERQTCPCDPAPGCSKDCSVGGAEHHCSAERREQPGNTLADVSCALKLFLFNKSGFHWGNWSGCFIILKYLSLRSYFQETIMSLGGIYSNAPWGWVERPQLG